MQSVTHLTADPGVTSSCASITFVEIDHEIILHHPLIQEGQLSVIGENLCTNTGKLYRRVRLPRKSGSWFNNYRLLCHLLVILKVISANSLDPDWVHTVCLYAKIGLKSLQEYSADDINKQHFQMQVFLPF